MLIEDTDTSNFYKQILEKQIYIDSNILMNEEFSKLLDELMYSKIIVKIPKIQYYNAPHK